MVARSQVTALEDLYWDCMPKATQSALRLISNTDILGSDWYLAGGTALALQMNHRQSVDLDFFCIRHTFDIDTLERQLSQTKQWKTSLRDMGTLYGTLTKAKVSFIAYPFFVPGKQRIRIGGVRILSKEDIAAMKIIAVSQRGRKRDFIDLYWYCQNIESLASVLARVPKQYPGQEHNTQHFLKSLVYFEDAEADPMPKIYFEVTWKKVKEFFQEEVPSIAKDVLK